VNDVNRKDELWLQWLLGIFGTTALFVALALIGSAIEGTLMGVLGNVLGTLAFGIGPFLTVASRPPLMTGWRAGLGMAFGSMVVLLIVAWIYGVEVQPLVLVAGLILGLLGGRLGEPRPSKA
jgi:hypothetical protein